MSENELEKDTVRDVFISYSSKDKTVTDALCRYLEEQKIRCWIAPRDIRPGQMYAGAIPQAIKSVKIFVLVCSRRSLQSVFVQKETDIAVNNNKIIIPFMIEDCSPEGPMIFYLAGCQWINAFPKPEEKFGDLAAAIIASLGERPAVPVEKTPVPVKKPSVPVEPPPAPVEKTPAPIERPSAPAGKTSTPGEEAPNSAERPSPETKYEFEGTSFSKVQILRIAKFQNWLFAGLLITWFLCILGICTAVYTFIHGDNKYLWLSYGVVTLLGLLFFAISRILQQKKIFDSFFVFLLLFVPVLNFFFYPVFLLHVLSCLKKILDVAGLKTFWGCVSKSEIEAFSSFGGVTPDFDEKPPVSVEKTSTPGEETPNSAEQPSPEKQYKFEDTLFSKAQILRIAKFHNWLFLGELIMLSLCAFAVYDLTHGDKYFWHSYWVITILGLLYFAVSGVLRVFDKLGLSLVILCPALNLFSTPAVLFYILYRSGKILHDAGLKTFWGWVPKSEIRKFAEGSDSQTER